MGATAGRLGGGAAVAPRIGTLTMQPPGFHGPARGRAAIRPRAPRGLLSIAANTTCGGAFCSEEQAMRSADFFETHPVFTGAEFSAARAPARMSPHTTRNLLAEHLALGRLVRIRRGLHATVPLDTAPTRARNSRLDMPSPLGRSPEGADNKVSRPAQLVPRARLRLECGHVCSRSRDHAEIGGGGQELF